MFKTIILSLFSVGLFAQQYQPNIETVLSQAAVPTGSCTGQVSTLIRVTTSPYGVYQCGANGAWVLAYGPVTGSGNIVLASSPTINTPTIPSTGIGSVVANVCHAQYSFAVDGGADSLITPASNCTIPANSIIYNEAIDFTTAVTSGGSATVSIGTTGTGSSATALLGATAKGSLTGIVQGAIVPQTASGWVKITTAGQVTLTPAVATLTAGVADIYVFYLTASN